MKHHLEQQQEFLIAGDSGYPISNILVKPYLTTDAAQDPRKQVFNKWLSGFHTAMSENVFGQWKRRFPFITAMRTKLDLSQKIVVATAILHNISKLWVDEDESDEGESDANDDDEDHDPDVMVTWNLRDSAAAIRRRGQMRRKQILHQMV